MRERGEIEDLKDLIISSKNVILQLLFKVQFSS